MDSLDIMPCLMETLSNTNNYELFSIILEVVGNILSCSSRIEFTEKFIAYCIDDILNIAWKRFEHYPDLNKEFLWIYSNLLTAR